MNNTEILLVVLIVLFVVVLLVLVSFLRRVQLSSKNQVEELVDRIFGASANKITEHSRQLLASETSAIRVELETKHQQLSKLVKDVEVVMDKRQQELKILEKDRAEQFGSLVKQIESHQRVTEELRGHTEDLARALSSNQARGSWGERIIEDLLQANGLLEGVHYQLQKNIGNTDQRPDVKLLLPDNRVVPVDVKFPFAALQQWAASDDVTVKKNLLKQFSADVKKHIEKVATYIMPSEGTLDYVVLFVPNEAVFSFLNQKLPDLVDYALAKRVLITSPFTFLIVARTIIESYRNFLLGDTLRSVLDQIDGFLGEWEKYRQSVEKMGRAVETLHTSWRELGTTRAKQLQKRILKVQETGQVALAHRKQPKAEALKATHSED